jgi:hypothetical protein
LKAIIINNKEVVHFLSIKLLKILRILFSV